MKRFISSFLLFLKNKKYPNKEDLVEFKEKSSKFTFSVALFLIIFSFSILLSIFIKITDSFSVLTPDYRGSTSIGIIGSPSFTTTDVNNSDSDKILKTILDPFKIKSVSYKNNVPSEIKFSRNKSYEGKKPFLRTIYLKVYSNQLELYTALKDKDIESTNSLENIYIDDFVKENFNIKQIESGSSIDIWVKNSETNSSWAKTLASKDSLIDKNLIIDNIENGYGIPMYLKGSSSNKVSVNENLTLSIAVQKDESLIKTAETLSLLLQNFGIILTVQAFDQGAFNDQLRSSQHSLILANSSSDIEGYSRLIPLYKKTFTHISSKDLNTNIPTYSASIQETFGNLSTWYKNTDKVWKWFIDKN